MKISTQTAPSEDQSNEFGSLQETVSLTHKPLPGRVSIRVRIFIAALLFIIAVSVRITSIRTFPPNPDEHHWVSRSALINERYSLGAYTALTSHLPHPGIPAAIVMALGQTLAERLNSALGSSPHSKYYIDNLAASRLANVLISSLLFPVLLLFGSELLDFSVVLLASLLLLFESQHIALSRIAHIDAVLALLSTISVYLFISGERTQNTRRKLLAGLFWGLSIATKPTALALIGVFFLYKVLRALFCLKADGTRYSILSWSEIWAVVVGHLVLALTYTKLWDPQNTYITNHHINPSVCGLIEHISHSFQSTPSLKFLLLISVSALSIFLFIRNQENQSVNSPSFHLAMLLCFIGTILTVIVFYPVASANLVRFWGWVLGLSKRAHIAYGVVWKEPPLGYLDIWFRRIPSIILLGSALAVPFLIGLFREWKSKPLTKTVFTGECFALLFTLALAPIVWTLPLSISSKQTIRYVLPVYPELFLFAAWGFVQFGRWLEKKWSMQKYFLLLPKTSISAAILCLAFFTQMLSAYAAAPNHMLAFNRISGGLRSAVERGLTVAPVGYDRALDYLQSLALETDKKQRLEVIGDVDLMEYAYARLTPKKQRYIDIIPFQNALGSEWLLEFPSFSRRTNFDASSLPQLEPMLSHVEQGVTVFTLYRIHPANYSTPKSLALTTGLRQGGDLNYDDGIESLIADPNRSRAGYIQYHQFVRLAPGAYDAQFSLTIPKLNNNSAVSEPAPQTPEESTKPFVRFEFSSGCKREVSSQELKENEESIITLTCTFQETTRAQLTVYWYGSRPLKLSKIQIVRSHS